MVSGSLQERENFRSKSFRSDDDWDPEWIEYVFSASAKCSNTKCKQDYVISGTGGVGPSFDDEYGQTLEDYFAPKACFPMPQIIQIPTKCPSDVTTDLIEAFALFWAHRGSSANAIRSALEKLMTHQGIPEEIPTTKDPSKMAQLNLHQRIELYAKNEPVVGPQLMALKWLGNTGSHGSKVNVEDLLDAFEILEYALEEIIESKSKKVAQLAAELTKKHS